MSVNPNDIELGMVDSQNPAINIAREHLKMRNMIEELQYGFITYNAWMKKHKNFMCDPLVEAYVDYVIDAVERFTPPPQRTQN
jgi:hypothetical protein